MMKGLDVLELHVCTAIWISITNNDDKQTWHEACRGKANRNMQNNYLEEICGLKACGDAATCPSQRQPQ